MIERSWAKIRENRRSAVIIALLVLLVMIVSLPMRLALAAGPFDRGPVQIFSARGTVWDGRLHDVNIGPVTLGSINASLNFWPLFVGRQSFALDLEDEAKTGHAILSHQWAWSGYRVSDMNVALPLDRLFASLPAGDMRFEDFHVRFAGDKCLSAGGRISLALRPILPGLSGDDNMVGVPRCSGDRLLLPLVDGTATRALDIFIASDGEYRATLKLEALPDIDPLLLEGRGFERSGGRWQMQLGGRF